MPEMLYTCVSANMRGWVWVWEWVREWEWVWEWVWVWLVEGSTMSMVWVLLWLVEGVPFVKGQSVNTRNIYATL